MLSTRLALAALVLTAAPASAQFATPTHPNLVFATVPVTGGGTLDLRLDLYLPDGASGPLPTVVWIHGGGWQMGSKFPTRAAPLVNDGYAVASIEYRLTDEAIWPAQIHDCKAAIRWLRANAPTYGLDPDRFGVAGSSAGGHLAAFVGTSADEGTITIATRSSISKARSGRTSINRLECRPSRTTSGRRTFCACRSLPRTSTPMPQAHRHRSWSMEESWAFRKIQSERFPPDPTLLLSRDDPPFRIVQGTADLTVPYDQSEHLWRTATEVHGLDWELVPVPDGGHGGPAFGIDFVRDFFDVELAPRAVRVRLETVAGTSEGGAPGALRIVREGSTTEEVVVVLDSGGTARARRDYVPLPQLVVFAPGVTERILPFAALQDPLVEGTEVARVGIVADPAYRVAHDGATALLPIADDDDGSTLPVVTVDTVDDVATEGADDSGLVRFSRSTTTGSLTVRYALRGTVTPASRTSLCRTDS